MEKFDIWPLFLTMQKISKGPFNSSSLKPLYCVREIYYTNVPLQVAECIVGVKSQLDMRNSNLGKSLPCYKWLDLHFHRITEYSGFDEIEKKCQVQLLSEQTAQGSNP
ncbi:hypothetical protein HGM15179_014658 [Zosterops borbonicus]|uniref:Uncharacterized protein n=1 Tax=Zosterops borbonicus TaxID=364589 RepID=A0A8K1LG49_9PASS|nr:hypothetical protein HGM15179_014658 [Zosterops borbonicus]